MPKRKRLRNVTIAQVGSSEAPLDLRPHTILNPKEKVVGFEVDNPNYDPRKKPEEQPDVPKRLIMWRSTRDPLAVMYAGGSIDEPRRLAGEHWRECYRLCEIGGVRGQDLTREYVDRSHSGNYEPVGDRQIKASKDLKKAAQALGMIGEWLVQRILGDGLFPKQVAELTGDASERKIRFYCERFREALQTLAITFTYCS